MLSCTSFTFSEVNISLPDQNLGVIINASLESHINAVNPSSLSLQDQSHPSLPVTFWHQKAHVCYMSWLHYYNYFLISLVIYWKISKDSKCSSYCHL